MTRGSSCPLDQYFGSAPCTTCLGRRSRCACTNKLFSDSVSQRATLLLPYEHRVAQRRDFHVPFVPFLLTSQHTRRICILIIFIIHFMQASSFLGLVKRSMKKITRQNFGNAFWPFPRSDANQPSRLLDLTRPDSLKTKTSYPLLANQSIALCIKAPTLSSFCRIRWRIGLYSPDSCLSIAG